MHLKLTNLASWQEGSPLVTARAHWLLLFPVPVLEISVALPSGPWVPD